MIIRIVEGTQGIQGTVSGTDQTIAALTNADDHTAPNVLRVWLENQSSDEYVKKSGDTMTGELVVPAVSIGGGLVVPSGIVFSNLPTVSGGLQSGELWVDTASDYTLKVTPP